MLNKIFSSVEISANWIKDTPILLSIYGIFFNGFNGAITYLCNISLFGLSVDEAVIVWDMVLKTGTFILTSIWVIIRIYDKLKLK